MSIITLLSKDKRNIIICPHDYNEGFFNEASGEHLYDIVFKRVEDFNKDIFGKLTDYALFHLYNSGHTPSAANEIINCYPLIKDKYTYLEKFNTLYNPGMINYYRDKNILYTMDSMVNPIFLYALKILKDNGINATLIPFENKSEEILYKEYPNIIREVEEAAEYISSLLDSGVSLDKIKVHCLGSDYTGIINDVFSFYPFKNNYYINNKTTLFEVDSILNFYKNAEDPVTMDQLVKYKDTFDDDTYLVLGNLISGYYVNKEVFKFTLKHKYLKTPYFKNAIEVGDVFDKYLSDDTYLIILGANIGMFPSVITLPGILNTEVLSKIPTSLKELNNYNEDYYLKKVYSLKHVYISSYIKGLSKDFTKSEFINRIDNVKDYISSSIRYSKERDILRLSKGEDEKITYGSLSKDYVTFKSLDDEKFKNYRKSYSSNNDFNDKELFKVLIDNCLNLSYTKINDYAECPFKYFYSHIYELDKFKDSLAIYIGNFFHFLMEKCGGDKDSLDEAKLDILIDEFNAKTDYVLTVRGIILFGSFYVEALKLFKEMVDINTISDFTKAYREKKIYTKTKTSNDITYLISGKIDLVLIDSSNNAIIVDYKTGSHPTPDLEKGTGLQNLIYFSILREMKGQEKLVPCGFFYECAPVKDYPLKPITIEGEYDKDVLEGTRLSSKYSLDGMPKKNSKSQPFTKEELEDRIEKAKETYDKLINDITSLKFNQTPSKEACRYCKFKDICYKYDFEKEDEEEIDE